MPPEAIEESSRGRRQRVSIPRLLSLVLLQINVISSLAVLGFLATVTFGLGMFYAADSLFYPLFGMGDLQQTLVASLPSMALSLIVAAAGLSLLPSQQVREATSEARPRTLFRSFAHVLSIIILIVFALMSADIIGIWFLAFSVLTFAVAIIVTRARAKLKINGTLGWQTVAQPLLTAGAILIFILTIVFAMGYIQVQSKVDDFASSNTYLVSAGRAQRIAILVSGETRTLYYDGRMIKTAGAGFLDRVVVRRYPHRSAILCLVTKYIGSRTPAKYCQPSAEPVPAAR